MTVDLELAPKHKRPAGEPCCEPVVYPDVERREAERLAAIAKALGDPIRLQLVDVLRKHAGKVCVCELVPLLEVSQEPGVQLLRLARANPGGRSVGDEVSLGMHARTHKRVERAGLAGAVRVIEGSELEVPIADESFDLLIIGYMLDLLPRDEIP